MNIGISPIELHDEVQRLVNWLVELKDYDLVTYTACDEDDDEGGWDPNFSAWWKPASIPSYESSVFHFEEEIEAWRANPVGAMPEFHLPVGHYAEHVVSEWIALAEAKLAAKNTEQVKELCGFNQITHEDKVAFAEKMITFFENNRQEPK